MHLLYVKEYMTFESGMIGIVGGIGAVGEDMVRCADQSYIVGFLTGKWKLWNFM